jgi:hypothetical protein
MGYFCVALGKTWQENLDECNVNIELLKATSHESGDYSYLFNFMQSCLDKAKEKYIADIAILKKASEK